MQYFQLPLSNRGYYPHDCTWLQLLAQQPSGLVARFSQTTLYQKTTFPDIDSIPRTGYSLESKILVLCYPNSPFGQTAAKDFIKKVVDFAKKNRIIVVQDAAHMMLSYETEPLSFLSIDGSIKMLVLKSSRCRRFPHDRLAARLGLWS